MKLVDTSDLKSDFYYKYWFKSNNEQIKMMKLVDMLGLDSSSFMNEGSSPFFDSLE